VKRLWIILSVFWLWTCSDSDSGGPTEPEEPSVVISLSSLSGQVQKGPFTNGTSITISELENSLTPTGKNFNTNIQSNTGAFSVANVQLVSPYVEARASGFYFNEVTNEISTAQLSLNALSNLQGKTTININLLSHLEYLRIKNLISGNNPLSFAVAKNQALTEVLSIFDFSKSGVSDAELLDITQSGDGNAKLLAISSIMLQDRSVGQFSELLANISTDIASDGVLNSESIKNQLLQSARNVDAAQIRQNLINRYAELEVTVAIPEFESEVISFLKPPTAQDISVSINEDQEINISLVATDPDNNDLTYSTVEVNNATVSINGSTANYIPNANWNGVDTFTYIANDGISDSNIATVTINVASIDEQPNTLNIEASTDEDVSIILSLQAEEYDDQSYSFSIITQPANGTVGLDGTQATYTPNQDFNGTDTFTFEATDDRTARMNVATATITVNPINDTPTVNSFSIQLDENRNTGEGLKEKDLFGDISNNSISLDFTFQGNDVDGDQLTYSIVSNPANGSVTIDGDTGTFTPNDNWNGMDAFSYVANDGEFDSNSAAVTVTVDPVNDAPVTEDLTATVEENSAVDIALVGTDIDSGTLTYSLQSTPSNGTVAINNATATYTPTAGYFGSDSFTYYANDGDLNSEASTVSITVTEFNNAPVTEDVSATIDENRSMDRFVGINLIGSDEDGDELTYLLVTNPSNGNATIAGDVLTYTANQDWNGVETFSYKANDGDKDSNTSAVTVLVNAVNDAPVATNQEVTVSSNSSENTFDFNVTDVDNNNLYFELTSGGAPLNGGVVYDNSTAQFTYTPNENYVGYDSFTYQVSDGVETDTATVTISVDGSFNFTYPIEEGLTLYGGSTVDITWTGGRSNLPNPDGGPGMVLSLLEPNGNFIGHIYIVWAEDNINEHQGELINPNTFRWNITNDGKINGNDAGLVDGQQFKLALYMEPGYEYNPPINRDVSSVFTFKSYNATFTNPSSSGSARTFSVGSEYTITWTYGQSPFPQPKFILEENTQWGTSNDPVWEERFSENLSAEATSYIWTPQSGLTDTENYSLPAHYRIRIIDDSLGGEIAAETTNFYIDNDVHFDGIVSPVDGTKMLLGLTVDIVWRGGFPNTGIELIDNINGADEEKILDIATNINSNYYTIGAVNENTTTYSWTIPTDLEPKNSYAVRVYDASDDGEESAFWSTEIQINNPPTTSDVSTSGDEDTNISIGLAGSDVDGAVMLYSIVTQPTNGTVNIASTRPNNSFSYTPNANWNGTDSFTYKANDYIEDSNVSTYTITVNPVNDAPVSNDYSNNVEEGQSQDFPISNLGSDIDNDDGDLSVVLVSNPSFGTFQRQTNTNNNFYEYVPSDSNFAGTESFTFKLNDGSLLSNESTITFIYSNADDDSPSANDVTATTDEDVAIDIALDGSDPDGDNLTYSIVSGPSNGSVVIGADTATYTPTADFNGTDTFTYKANDGTVDSNTSTVTITITSVNDAPVANDANASMDENKIAGRYQPLTFTLDATDVDGDDLTYSVVGTNNGTVTVNGLTATYTPNQDWNGEDTFTYKANDGELDSNTATVTIIVNSVNDAPVATNQEVTIFSNSSNQTFDLKVSDIDSNDLDVSIVNDVSNGSLSLNNSTNQFTYTPNANYVGIETFTYQVSDGSLTDTAVDTVVVDGSFVFDYPQTSGLSFVGGNSVDIMWFGGTGDQLTPNGNAALTLQIIDTNGDFSTDLYAVYPSGISNCCGTLTNPTTFRWNIPSDGVVNDITLVSGAQYKFRLLHQNGNEYTPSINGEDSVLWTFVGSNNRPTLSDFPDWRNVEVDIREGITSKVFDLSPYANDLDGHSLTYHIDSQTELLYGSASISGSILTYSYTGSLEFDVKENIYIYVNDGIESSDLSGLQIWLNVKEQYISDISEYSADAYQNNFSGDLITQNVSYDQHATGSTGFLIGSRAGVIEAESQIERDFDRFNYWQDRYSFEINFNETSLAWDYADGDVNGSVPFSIYVHDSTNGTRMRLHAVYWDKDGSNTWNQFDTNEPTYDLPAYEPIYAYFPQDESAPYNPESDSTYIAQNSLTGSGSFDWAYLVSSSSDIYYLDHLPSGQPFGSDDGRAYPVLTGFLVTQKDSSIPFENIPPTAANHSALNTGKSEGSVIFLKTENGSRTISSNSFDFMLENRDINRSFIRQ
jgi:hypothetical protein